MSRRFLLTARTFGIEVCCKAAAHYAPSLANGPGDGRQWGKTCDSAQILAGQQEALPVAQWHDAMLRQIVQLSIGGTQLRARVSNVFGTQPLVLDPASIALSTGTDLAVSMRSHAEPARQTGHRQPSFLGASGLPCLRAVLREKICPHGQRR
jgi:hypothetical protein